MTVFLTSVYMSQWVNPAREKRSFPPTSLTIGIKCKSCIRLADECNCFSDCAFPERNSTVEMRLTDNPVLHCTWLCSTQEALSVICHSHLSLSSWGLCVFSGADLNILQTGLKNWTAEKNFTLYVWFWCRALCLFKYSNFGNRLDGQPPWKSLLDLVNMPLSDYLCTKTLWLK